MAAVATSNKRRSSPELETIPTQSSFIAAFEYDPGNLTLTTHMMNGAIYQHKGFDTDDWEELKTSQNHGKHWSNFVKGKKRGVLVKSAKMPNSAIKLGRQGK